ncbi:MAG: LacI family DNA-binding transcriptional regulator [Bifidobacterium sp.]|jgi:DNA-binding LacI/PurR family transcriptional regulator|nr:LacI family DNA-binding transcriptional regulator [Bifidobacterium sp.]MCH4175609.1 LacI family DNA-binding transcriptional regulator [Bifidobacterium sp.]
MTTITDVARVAGVSKNTVSRFLNERGYISQKTRTNIQEAIDSLHYQPNQIARSLYTSKTNLVGLVIPDVAHPFFSMITSLIEDELDQQGYKMILCNTMHSSSKEKKYLDMLTANKVDGIIIGSHSIDISYSDINAPIVALDRDLAQGIPVVTADHDQGGHIAANAFIAQGCKNVAQLVGFSQVRTPSNRRHTVFAEVMRSHHIHCVTHELKLNQFAFSTYLSTADDILNRYPELDGIFAADPVAVAVQRQALARGLRIPDDLFLFGYDGSFLAQVAYPPLPTVVQPYESLAQTVVEVLLHEINQESLSSQSYILPVESSFS